MRKALFVVVLLAAVVAGAVAYLYFSGAEYVVEIPESEINAALKKRFPIRQEKAGVLKTSLSNPRLQLDGGTERLYMDMKVDVDLGLTSVGIGRSERGAATISSGLRYNPKKGRLLLDGARLEELRVADLPDKYRGPVEEVVNKALTDNVDGLVVYELSSGSYKESLAKLFLKDIEVGDGALRAVLGIGS